jgi:hypothetical protein
LGADGGGVVGVTREPGAGAGPPRPAIAGRETASAGQRGTAAHEAPGGGGATGSRVPSSGAAPADDLLPPPVAAPRLNGVVEPAPFGSYHQQADGPGPARVSIGTIEVTVVPPARPPVPASVSRPPAPGPRGRSRPPSLLATTASDSRLRDGLRRWYGIAQG